MAIQQGLEMIATLIKRLRRVQWLAVFASLGVVVVAATYLWYTWQADLSEWLERSDHIGGLIVGISVIWASTRYLLYSKRTADSERQASHYLAWQTISAAQGKPGNGGRADALRALAMDGVSLSGVNIDGAHLAGLSLPPSTDLRQASLRCVDEVCVVLCEANLDRANLVGARLEGVDLTDASLRGADLSNARLDGATLLRAKLEWALISNAALLQADLRYASLCDADLSGTDLTKARLRHANLDRVNFSAAVLTGADLKSARLHGSNLRKANLDGANLEAVTWDDSSTWIEGASIRDLRNAPPGFREWAIHNGAIAGAPVTEALPSGLEYSPPGGPKDGNCGVTLAEDNADSETL